MIIKNNEEYRVDLAHCQQCGTCFSVCSHDAVHYIRDAESGLLKFEISKENCIKCGRCYKFCPANKDTSLQNVESFIINKRYFIGHCSKNEIRRRASSGGVVRTIIVEGLRSGFFDGVYTLRKTPSYPFAEGYFFNRDSVVEYESIPNSVYHSVPLNLNIHTIKRCKRLLVVGTACQLRAIQTYVKGKCDGLFSICIYCKQQKTFESTRYLAKLSGERIRKFEDLSFVEYRGHGWPGRCQFNKKEVAWEFAASLPFGRRLWCVPGCDICGNPYGENTDITIMDPWGLDVDRATGDSLFSVNSENGFRLINEFVDFISYQEKDPNQIRQALSIEDIEKKNIMLPYYRGDGVPSELKKKGDRVIRKRNFLELLLSRLPRMPKLFYKILFRLVKI